MNGFRDAIEIHAIRGNTGQSLQRIDPDPTRVDRHRGLWSFLTRTFYLGQAITAQQLISGAAHAASTDNAAAQATENFADAAANQLQAGRDALRSSAESGETSSVPLPGQGLPGQSQAPGAQTSADLAKALAIEGADSAVPAGALSTGGAASGAAGTGGTSDVDPGPENIFPSGTELPGSELFPGVDIGGVLVPGIVVGVDLGNNGVSLAVGLPDLTVHLELPLDVGAVVSPVDNVMDALPLQSVADLAGSAAAMLSSPIIDTVSNVLPLQSVVAVAGDAAHGLASDLGEGPLNTPAVSALGHTLEDPLGSSGDPLSNTASETLAAVNAEAVTRILPSAPVIADVVAPGTLELGEAWESRPVDILYDANRYSDLNIELQSHSETSPTGFAIDTATDDSLAALDLHTTPGTDHLQSLSDVGKNASTDLV